METLSGTGVFYQAMPAIGADGKRIMKLIPVQMVNGQYVQTQTSKPEAAGTFRPAAVEPRGLAPRPPVGPVAGKPCSGAASSVAVPPTPGHPGLSSLVIKPQPVSVSSRVPPKTTLVTTRRRSPLPVTAGSPAPPKGQYFQVLPPSAQVWTVPASQLPQGIKTPSSTPGALNVVFVSPVTTVSPRVSPPGESGAVGPPSSTSTLTPGTRPHLKLIPKVSHRPNSPTRWVVEELGDSAVANGKPSHSSNFFETDHQGGAVFKEARLQSSETNAAEGPTLPRRWIIEEEHVAAAAPQSVVSEVLQVLSGRERVDAQQEAAKEVPSVSSQKNSLLMCNSKVVLVAQKDNLSFQATSPMNGSEFHQTAAISSPASVDGAARSQVERRACREVEEVIDLCDEEELPPPDEDNVIFVSYSPPKTQSGSMSHDVPLVVQGKVTDRTDTRGSGRGGQPERTWPASHHKDIQPHIVEVDAETKSPADPSSRETKSPGDPSSRETKSPGGSSSRETKSPGDPSSRETKSPGDPSSTETKGPGDPSSRETKSPGDPSSRETKSPGDPSSRETKSLGDPSSREMKSPGDPSSRETKGPGDPSSRETKSPGDPSSRETKSPGDPSSRETKSPGDPSSRETKSPGDPSSRETKGPGDPSSRETKSPGDPSSRETKGPGDPSSRETKSPGDPSSRETKSPGDPSSRETKSPGDPSSRETKSPGDPSSRETKGPGDPSSRETKSPGDPSSRETKSPGDPSSRETENNMNSSTSCAHVWTSPSMDVRLRQVHGVTAEVRVVLQRLDEAAAPRDQELRPGLPPPTWRSSKPPCDRASEFRAPRAEGRSRDPAVRPNMRRLGRTRKRTMCKCCSPDAKSSTRVAGHALTAPPAKKGPGARTPAGDEEPCRTPRGPETRTKQPCGNSKDLNLRVRVQTVKRLHDTLLTSGVS